VRPAVGAALLFSLAAAALLAERTISVAVIAALLLVICLRAPVERRWIYLVGALTSSVAVLVVSPFVEQLPGRVLWTGPTVPVLGTLDVTAPELSGALFNALRLAAVALAFSAYALLLDHDRLVQAAGFARRSVLAVALATRLMPALERDAAGYGEALRGRGLELHGVHDRARLLSPLVAGSLERSLNLAEAMEARGFGRAGATRLPQPAWSALDRFGLAASVAVVAIGALWL
jgi:energy-coupling factor transport system permease protein